MRRNTTSSGNNSNNNNNNNDNIPLQHHDVIRKTQYGFPIVKGTTGTSTNRYSTTTTRRNEISMNMNGTIIGCVSCCTILVLLYVLRDTPIEQNAIQILEKTKFVHDIEDEIQYIQQQIIYNTQRQPPKLLHDGHDEIQHDIQIITIPNTTTTKTTDTTTKNDETNNQKQTDTKIIKIIKHNNNTTTGGSSNIEQEDHEHHNIKSIAIRLTKDGRSVPDFTLQEISNEFHIDEESYVNKPIARGVAGVSINITNTVLQQSTTKRSSIQCDIPINSLAYWNDYSNTITDSNNNNAEDEIIDTFRVNNDKNNIEETEKQEYYLTFSPDPGGWNNIRMSMEIIFCIAFITGRTLVLPPKAPLYLLSLDKNNVFRGFGDFFPINTKQFQKQIKVISFAEFLNKVEPSTSIDNKFHVTNETYKQLLYSSSDHCYHLKKSKSNCDIVYDYLKTVGSTVPVHADTTCFIFDEAVYTSNTNTSLSQESIDYITTMCGTKRTPYYLTKNYNEQNILLHFHASDHKYRLLGHFYNFLFFTNPLIGNYYKRFVRDYLHYIDPIYCAAGKIIQAIQYEGVQRNKHYTNKTNKSSTVGVRSSYDGSGGFVTFHIRRGDLQYKSVKISAYEWYKNTKHLVNPGEIVYIATDERNKTWFEPLKEYYTIRFLDDYWDLAQLSTLDPNYMGMIDTIIASRGRVFVGTFFSTFTGYINRLRGYHGLSMKLSYYSWLPRYNHTHTWITITNPIFSFEWPDGWVGIDSNTIPNHDIF